MSRLDERQNKYQNCQHPAKKTQLFNFSESLVENRNWERASRPTANPFTHAMKAKNKPAAAARARRKRGRGTDLEEQTLTPRMFSALPLQGRIRAAGNSPQIPSPTTQQGSHRHPPNYAPLRERRHRVLINRRLAELSSGALTEFRSDSLFATARPVSAQLGWLRRIFSHAN